MVERRIKEKRYPHLSKLHVSLNFHKNLKDGGLRSPSNLVPLSLLVITKTKVVLLSHTIQIFQGISYTCGGSDLNTPGIYSSSVSN